MKKIVLLTIGIALSVLPLSAQRAEERIGELINRSDWFSLEEEYPALKDSVQWPFLRLLAETMICANFNRPEEAVRKIDTLVTDHSQFIGPQNVYNLTLLAAILNHVEGRHALTIDYMKKAEAYLQKEKGVDSKGFRKNYEYFSKYRTCPSPSLSRPDRDITVRAEIDTLKSLAAGGRQEAYLIRIPAMIHGRTYRAIFDTGASSTFMTEEFARKAGITTIVNDSFPINQSLIGGGYGKQGILDSLQVGDIVFRNVMVTIGKSDLVEKLSGVEFILGIDFMKLAGEFQIDVERSTVTFPVKRTPLPPTGRNLLLDNNSPRLKAYGSDNKRLIFHFDTGNATSVLYHTYYQKYKNEIDPIARRDTVTRGGYGFLKASEELIIPSFKFKAGDSEITLTNAHVIPRENRGEIQGCDGSVGMLAIMTKRKTIANLKEMFVRFE